MISSRVYLPSWLSCIYSSSAHRNRRDRSNTIGLLSVVNLSPTPYWIELVILVAQFGTYRSSPALIHHRRIGQSEHFRDYFRLRYTVRGSLRQLHRSRSSATGRDRRDQSSHSTSCRKCVAMEDIGRSLLYDFYGSRTKTDYYSCLSCLNDSIDWLTVSGFLYGWVIMVSQFSPG